MVKGFDNREPSTVFQGSIPLAEGLPELLQSVEIPGRVQRENDVQEAPPGSRPLTHQSHVSRREDYRRQPPNPVSQPLRFLTIQGDLLSFPPDLEGGRHLNPFSFLSPSKRSHNAKKILIKCHKTMVPAAPEGPEGLKVVDGLEKVRLSLSIFADDGNALGWQFQLLVGQIPKVPEFEFTQVHGDWPGEKHGGRPGRIPFCMKEFSSTEAFWLPLEKHEKP
jgi:hypothetical protein